MDAKNRFETRTTFALNRLEWLAFLAVSLVLAVRHHGEIRWWVFAGLFAVIDLVGYIPGAVAHRRAPDGRVPRGFYVAYNLMHSLVTAGVIAGAWALFVRPEWALLALPIHLMGDRALFGNSLKPFGVAFEPEQHEAYRDFEQRYRRSVAEAAAASAARTSREGTHAVRA